MNSTQEHFCIRCNRDIEMNDLMRKYHPERHVCHSCHLDITLYGEPFVLEVYEDEA